MAEPASLFFKENQKYGVGEITFDLVLSENHNFQSEISSHPVEDGSEITDHIHNLPEQGQINGLISNYSINAGLVVSNRAQDVFDALIELWKARTTVTITTVMRVYENVAISSMPFVRDNTQGESLPISISFKKVEIVKLQEITLELGVSPLDPGETDMRNADDTAKQVAPLKDSGQTVAEDRVPEAQETSEGEIAWGFETDDGTSSFTGEVV